MVLRLIELRFVPRFINMYRCFVFLQFYVFQTILSRTYIHFWDNYFTSPKRPAGGSKATETHGAKSLWWGEPIEMWTHSAKDEGMKWHRNSASRVSAGSVATCWFQFVISYFTLCNLFRLLKHFIARTSYKQNYVNYNLSGDHQNTYSRRTLS